MRYTRLFLPTVKDVPSEAEVISHQYMLRAGMIRKLASGIYSFLPLGLRALRKVEKAIREEMNRAGAQEVFLPSVQPAELWEETGRWDLMGEELLRFKDRHQRPFCYGPTHEEVITDLVRREVRSYRDLPLNLYQIQTKFRDEIRPRFGLMRGREFCMKDAYSFDQDEGAAEESYWNMFEAYKRIFERMDLDFRPVEAETGNIGGAFSHEFMVLAESGEDSIVFCTSCDYAANVEKAEIHPSQESAGLSGKGEPGEALELVETAGKRTVEEVTGFLGVDASRLIKTLVYRTEKGDFAVLVKGDREANEYKIRKVLEVGGASLASPEEVEEILGVPAGYVGPVKMPLPILADHSIRNMTDAVVGANLVDHHYLHFDPDRDLRNARFADLKRAEAGDLCARCGKGMEERRGIEVGHVFMLGTKYSESMRATYLDQHGKERPIWMGCYGIGVGRTLAAAIEQNHDGHGICFPFPIAPFSVILTALNPKDPKIQTVSEGLYTALQKKGVDVLFDDRDERPGKKFNDADLVGIPLRVTVGPRQLEEGKIEMKLRKEAQAVTVPVEGAADRIFGLLQEHDKTERPSS